MKRNFWWLALVGWTRIALAASVEPVSASSLFVPRGFDDNDDIAVTLDGYLPSTCYQITEPRVSYEASTRRIFVQAMAYVTQGPCAQVRVPFASEVKLGRLHAGPYTVLTPDHKLRQSLIVDPAPIPNQDNFLYAPIDSVMVAPSGSGLVAVLDGRYTDTCLRLKEVRVTRTGNTIQVLPILTLRSKESSGGTCRQVDLPFRLAKRLPALERGRYLLHVRSLNGRAINFPFTVTR